MAVIAFILSVICVAVIILGYIGVDVPLVTFTKASRFETALGEHNYQAAYTVYASTEEKSAELKYLKAHLEDYFEYCKGEEYDFQAYKGLEIFRNEIESLVEERLKDEVRRYYSGAYSEEEALRLVKRIGKFSFMEKALSDAVDEIYEKTASETAFSKGMEYYNNGEYELAVKEFKKVSEMDTVRYTTALDGIERIRQGYGKSKLLEAEKMIGAFNKEGAQELLEELIALFDGYPEAEEMLSKLRETEEE